ncbi:hypothetical protein LAZ67_8001401 [Cordylochernes scorpioides]|uniref:Transposase n=1 Tax=Cordylochernes scorpioides TaxID=51811 RepID=A0ABY6KT12_9ARAC|nr:hypothetical protein LAZ67_8001401 [Cordylochernes scorpioides]
MTKRSSAIPYCEVLLIFFIFGKIYLENEPRSGRPPTAVTQEKIELLRFLLREDRRITYQHLEKSVGIGSAANNSINNNHLKKKLVSIWVPYSLIKKPKIWSRDETWIYNFDQEIKRHSILWCSSKSPPPRKVRRARNVGKQMVAFFLEKVVSLILPRAQLRGILLHLDNARPHTSAQTLDLLANPCVQLVTHPPYSPEIALCVFYIYKG